MTSDVASQVSFKTVAQCLMARDRLGHKMYPTPCQHCGTNPCDGYYTKPIPETGNERIARALRKLADQVEKGQWDDVSNIIEIAGERIMRARIGRA